MVKYMIFLILIVTVICFCSYGYSKLNNKLEITSANNISLYDDSGEVFFQGNGSNKWVSLKDISINVINATISTEDKNFYKHFGFDFLRIIKAGYTNVINRKTVQGASTISQQYVKNLFLDFDKTWERKWNEMWLTINLELNYTKDEILEGYLNTINYGHGMFGIEKAANYYFNKSAKELNLAEASMLVGIPKSPSNYSPLINISIAKKRQKAILSSMVKNGYISEKEMNDAFNVELSYYGKELDDDLSTLMYFKDAVLSELEKISTIPNSFLDTGGIKIYTTLDIDAQKGLEKATKEYIKKDLQTASVSINPNNGEIIALIGGSDYIKSQYNRALSSSRQVGSTMKPFLYYAALENGFTASTCFRSEQTTFTFSNNSTYSPKNANEVYGNIPISLATAIAYSDNIYAVKTHMFLGEDTLVNTAKRLGITANLTPNPSLPLGTNEINIIDMTTAYSTFANNGYKVTPHLIKKVVDSNENVLYEYKEEKEQILNQSLVFILNELLTSTYDSAFIDYNYPTMVNLSAKMTKKYSVKSGTTATDLWTIGYNPNVITSVWVGYDDNKEITSNYYNIAKNIWLDSIEYYLKGKDEVWYEKPSNVVGCLVNPITGKPASDKDKNKKILYYLKGTEPTEEQMVFDEMFDN
ncbi:MAG: PBP1A family penicillin-binding protein [bacterium]|nr:PBP1A family penicillin-binding protein [bacterium]